MKNRLSLPLMVLVAVVALALGSFGTATAAGLTKAKVKKIATQVVNKKASSLTVANATNATNAANAATAANATNLGGKPASAYQDVTQTYTTAITTPVSGFYIHLPLTVGQPYEISYSAYLNGASTGDGGCYVWVTDSGGNSVFYTADDEADIQSNPAYSGVGVVTLAAGEKASLRCSATGTFTTLEKEPIQINITALDAAPAGTLPLSTGPAAAAAAAAHGRE
jgi:hypothetical protein